MLKYLLFILMSGLYLTGCANPTKVVLLGNESFPKEVAGVWVSEDKTWTIVFEETGAIEYAIIPLGEIRIQPGKITRFSIPKYEGKGIYEPGDWQVAYSSEGRELGVTLELKHFYQDVGNHAIEGQTTDYLVGRLYEDNKTWIADLQSSGKIEALIFDGWTLKERREMINNPEPEYRGKVVFHKVN